MAKVLQLVNGLSSCTTSGEYDEQYQGSDNTSFSTKDVARLCPWDDEASVSDQISSKNPSKFVVALKIIRNRKTRRAHDGDLHIDQKQA